MKTPRSNRPVVTILSLFLFLGAMMGIVRADEENVPRMTMDELRSMLGKPGVEILDVRVGPQIGRDAWKIYSAKRLEAKRVEDWAKEFDPSDTIVIYCS